MVGNEGKIYAVDLQEGMIAELKKRLAKAGVGDIVSARL
jgi:ubiquinone/menaquinone biosynthesis C-methylase UbiE